MKVNVKFKKLTTVDFEEGRFNEVLDKSFYHDEIIKDVVIEETVRGYVNLHFENGDIAIGIAKSSIEVVQ